MTQEVSSFELSSNGLSSVENAEAEDRYAECITTKEVQRNVGWNLSHKTESGQFPDFGRVWWEAPRCKVKKVARSQLLVWLVPYHKGRTDLVHRGIN